jgi:hypothetical protein
MARKVEFDFDAISVLGLKFNLPKGGAAKIGSSTGLGSDNNEKLIDKGNYMTKKTLCFYQNSLSSLLS